jgi:enoyl-CoA hydratase/carnithine racemase
VSADDEDDEDGQHYGDAYDGKGRSQPDGVGEQAERQRRDAETTEAEHDQALDAAAELQVAERHQQGLPDVLEDEDAGAHEQTSGLLALTHAVEDLPFPTLAVVDGLCLTAGLELALACDLLFASVDAHFGLVEKVVGITPLMGGTQRLAERACSARARELVMTGRLYPAAVLEAWGVVNQVLSADQLLPKSRQFAAELAAGPTIAHAATKAIVRAQSDYGTRGADERTAGLTSHLLETEDSRNAVRSFLAEGPGKAIYSGR